MQKRKPFVEKLLNWYGTNRRDLPWRNTKDPYVIWLSEVILQQTRVKQGLPYFNRFLEAFPDVSSLAGANEQEILRLWQGLGYYSRAKNLHACAKNVVTQFGGNFPRDFKSLLSLKGVGRYTAAAISSFAFDGKVAVVDGNVYRVLSRVFGLYDDIASPAGQKKFQEWADRLLPDEKTPDYNQAIMEFGALQCTPKQPLCEVCPCADFCYAFKHNAQKELPVKSKKVKVRSRYFNYFVIRHDNHFFMKKRDGKDIWNGLYDFYLIESLQDKQLDELESEELSFLKASDAVVVDSTGVYKHVLTHQNLFVKFFLIDLTNIQERNKLFDQESFRKFSLEEVKELPKPILIDNYLSKNFF